MSDTSECLNRLIEKLEAAYAVSKDPNAPAIKGPGHATASVMEFLEEIGIEARLLSPILSLNMAIDDHLRGKPNPMLLEVHVPSNRPPESISSEYVKGIASAAMTLFMDAGETKEQAARLVVRTITRWGEEVEALFSGGAAQTESWKRVCNWRERIKRQNRTTDYGGSVYYSTIEHLKQRQTPPREGAMALLSQPHPAFVRKSKEMD